MPITEPEFERVNRFWDPKNQSWAAKISPGEYYTSTENELISTVLGSCIAACIRSRRTGIGGMNHFMLPTSPDAKREVPDSLEARYGSIAMEKLINSILKYGGSRRDLEVKLFGGARVLEIDSAVGEKNIEFALSYVRTEGLNLLAVDLGGTSARKVQYFPKEGKARVRQVSLKNNTVKRREQSYEKWMSSTPVQGEITIFSEDDL